MTETLVSRSSDSDLRAIRPSDHRTLSQDLTRRGGLLVVAKWQAKRGEEVRIADIIARFLPEAQAEPGVVLFLIGRARENPGEFLFYELFRDEAAFAEHQASPHFRTLILEQALPLLETRERGQYALV